MKAILLNGSPRNPSNTLDALKVCASKMEEYGVETEIISLRDKKIQSCIACNACKKTGNCVLDDGLSQIIDKLRNADIFVPAAPVYFGTARGDIMSALQRIGKVSRGTDKFLKWMVGGPIAVGRRGGMTLTLQEMSMFFPINNMILAGSSYWNMLIGSHENDVLEDAEGIKTIEEFSANVALIAEKLK